MLSNNSNISSMSKQCDQPAGSHHSGCNSAHRAFNFPIYYNGYTLHFTFTSLHFYTYTFMTCIHFD